MVADPFHKATHSGIHVNEENSCPILGNLFETSQEISASLPVIRGSYCSA